MSLLLQWLRYLLLIVPALGTLLTTHVEFQNWFTFFVLLVLLIMRAGELYPGSAKWLMVVELAGISLLAYHAQGLMFMLLFSSLIVVGVTFRSPQATTFVVLTGAVLLGICLQHRSPELIWTTYLLWFSVAAVLYTSSRISDKHQIVESLYEELNRSHEELEQARRRLEEYGAQIGRYAQAEERSRIATDIHDDLGHRLIRQKMMMEAALQLYEQHPERAYSMFERVRSQMEESMERMRRTLRRLSPAEPRDAREYALDQLIADAGRELGISVTFAIEGHPQPLYPSMEYVLYRNAQEAITNAVRHGSACTVNVRLNYSMHEIALTVANDGSLPDAPISHGLGLRGMKERILMLGGRLEVSVSPEFAITTTLPLAGAAPQNLSLRRDYQ
ncbi:sensor histidine kinase [Paenibacillus nasutitermitis]|uniref:histidine kinase n=1 Tax=Paenibacillus nasutitermitis TaxID=1652958 RepID=A0A916Z0Y2_9BACL|nr:sensor histidine kinase [Paenibacillus nasutitermitis]GGD70460.1 histidine kinase [Paenibacillus nasutitermitis]